MLTLVRDIRTNDAILGSLYLNGAFICYTLENAAKAIPCGLYKVENSISPKFKRELPLLHNKDVPAKKGVRIHVGNYYHQSSACVLVGMGRKMEDFSLTESTNAETMVTMICRNENNLVIVESWCNSL